MNKLISFSILFDLVLFVLALFLSGFGDSSMVPILCYFIASPIFLLIWLWANDNKEKEKYPKTTGVISTITTILLVIPWVGALILIFVPRFFNSYF